jgi:hypothetical protein
MSALSVVVFVLWSSGYGAAARGNIRFPHDRYPFPAQTAQRG